MRRILLIVAAIGIISLSGIGSAVAGYVRGVASSDSAGLQAAVPSGATIQGAVGGDFDAPAATLPNDWGITVSLPLRARNYITDADVYINVNPWGGSEGQVKPTTTDTNVGCSGTRANPTAPAGKVCIYVTGGDNATNVKGVSIVPGTGGNPLGFKLVWTATHAGDTFVEGTWAYHAP